MSSPAGKCWKVLLLTCQIMGLHSGLARSVRCSGQNFMYVGMTDTLQNVSSYTTQQSHTDTLQNVSRYITQQSHTDTLQNVSSYTTQQSHTDTLQNVSSFRKQQSHTDTL